MVTSPEVNRIQFDEQAGQFAEWAARLKDPASMANLSAFIGFSPADTMLDVACGPGNFVIFASATVRSATGIDISSGQLNIAREQAAKLRLQNVNFVCGNVETLPFRDNLFPVVTSDSAFHHFGGYEKVFAEMYRVCRPGGKLCISDITTYEDPEASRIINQMDRLMDTSHHRRMSPDEITQLFLERGMRVDKREVSEFEILLEHYRAHALQTPENATLLEELMNKTVQNGTIHKVLYRRNGETYFLNRGFTIVGTKHARGLNSPRP